ncbi:hemerythrin domain-containing protein [Porphyromonas pogonae]|uniref:hemerythrin domain-containing protein n=1 Tax=Porphyromonas pogonae TaxID=867595 RepID=UPI002E77BECF|nr:hemerythrin domain-containing protein [Porphyromonas pogonae]
MSDLICDNYGLLLVITRFGIPLGFGDSNLEQVCQKHNVDKNTLLLVLNTLINTHDKPSNEQLKKISLSSLIEYLRNSHSFFLDFRLPYLREQLLDAINKTDCPAEVAFVIRKFFDDYVEEVRKHMSYEEKIVFPYALDLEKKGIDKNYNIGIFSKRHDQIEMKITELKNILIKYYPSPSGYELNSVLHDIFSSEEDLASHNYVEDHIFVPLIELMEQQDRRAN